ncbi:MAG: diaminopimelate epimerase [Candidatus Sulfotelmatobacter sp.]
MSVASGVIPFVKASACGNDFLLIDGSLIGSLLAPAEIGVFTRRICDRHEGVGADGVEWMLPHAAADVEIKLINADGSAAEISGNGTRCVAAYLCEERGKETIRIQTGAGLKVCVLTARSDAGYEFEMGMGEAVVEKALTVLTGFDEVWGIPVSIGNPHYVVFVNRFDENWQAQAADIQRYSRFEHGVNVELVMPEGKHDLHARFFERGVGETQSSGTGSCAAAVAAISTGRFQSPVKVHAPGGTQTVRWENNQVFLRGSARLVCRGEFFLR